jgi:hypothetical protein
MWKIYILNLGEINVRKISNAEMLIEWQKIILPPTRKKVAFLFENSYLAKYSIN